MLGVLPGHGPEPVLGDRDRNVRADREAVPVDHGVEHRRRLVAVGLADRPGRQDSAAASARDVELVRIHIPEVDHRIHPRVQVEEVVPGIRMVDQVAEFLAVRRAAARVGVQHDVAGRGHRLLLDVEAIAVVREGSAVDLEHQRVAPVGVEAGRLDDPALDLEPVVGRRPADLLDCAERLVTQDIVVHRGHHPHVPPVAPERDLAQHRRRRDRVGEHSAGAHRKAPAAVRRTRSAHVLGHDMHLVAARFHVCDLRVAVVGVREVEPLRIRRPRQAPHGPVELSRHGPCVRPVAVGHHQPGDLVALVAVVEAGVRDPATIRRDRDAAVGALAVRQCPDPAVQRNFVHLRVAVLQLPVGVTVRRDQHRSAIGRPHRLAPARPPHVPAVVEVAACDPPRRPTLRGHHEQVGETVLQIARSVKAVDQLVDHPGGLGPLGAFRRLGHGDERHPRRGYEGRKGDVAAVRRPGGHPRLLDQVGDPPCLPGVHPADVDLGRRAFPGATRVRQVEQASAVRGPPGPAVALLARGQRPQLRAIPVHDPQVRIVAVGLRVGPLPHENDSRPVGRDLRVAHEFQVEDIDGGEDIERLLGDGRPRGCEQGGGDQYRRRGPQPSGSNAPRRGRDGRQAVHGRRISLENGWNRSPLSSGGPLAVGPGYYVPGVISSGDEAGDIVRAVQETGEGAAGRQAPP